MTNFNGLKEKYFDKLETYVPVVARVHGATHPEFLKVYEVYKKINKKIKETETDRPDLNDEFKELRKITNNYKVPEDTCESYEAVYNMLAELDEAYSNEGI